MYKLDIAVDTRESAALERHRNMEKQRQGRIFNARERTIGVSEELHQRETTKSFCKREERL